MANNSDISWSKKYSRIASGGLCCNGTPRDATQRYPEPFELLWVLASLFLAHTSRGRELSRKHDIPTRSVAVRLT